MLTCAGRCRQGHAIVGTSFNPTDCSAKMAKSWKAGCCGLLSPRIGFHFQISEIDGRSVVLLEIDSAFWRSEVSRGCLSGLPLQSHSKELSLKRAHVMADVGTPHRSMLAAAGSSTPMKFETHRLPGILSC